METEMFTHISIHKFILESNLKWIFFLWQDDSLKQLQVVHQPWILPSDTESEGVEAEQEKRE